MRLVFLLLSVALAATGDVIVGNSAVTFDFSGFSQDVSVSTCDAATYSNQGGQLRTYVIPSTQFVTPCNINIVEGGHITKAVSVNIFNGAIINVPRTSYLANLTIHLEQYNPGEVGNSYCVRLRTQNSPDLTANVFRVYCDLSGPVNSNRLPLNSLTGGVVPATRAYVVPVLSSSQSLTVYAEETTPTNPTVAFTIGHTAQGLTRDSDCSDNSCDSGRLVATLEVPLECDIPTENAWPTTDVFFSWNPTPEEYPIQPDFRHYPNQAGGSDYYYYVLAADNYRVRVQYPSSSGATVGGAPHSKTVAAACYPGTCEAKAITSVLTLNIPGLSGTVQLGINGTTQWSAIPNQSGLKNYCVFNLLFTEATVSFGPGLDLTYTNINCETINQRCNAGVYTAQVCPDFGCLTGGGNVPLSVTYNIFSQSRGILYTATGAPATTLACKTVPAFGDVAVEVIESGPNVCPSTYSCTSCAAANSLTSCGVQVANCGADPVCLACITGGIFSPACQVQNNTALNALKTCQQSVCPTCASVQNPFTGGCVRTVLPTTPCNWVRDSDSFTQSKQCTTVPAAGTFGRILSIFELFFLPADGVTVSFTTLDNVVFRTLTNQGGAPRCYCVLPSLLNVQIRDGASTWGSQPENCLAQLAPPASYDCTICDFLSIATFDLTGLPRTATATFRAQLTSVQPPNIATATPFRTVTYVGAIQNHVAVLRSGAGTLPPQRFFLTINDNGATKSLSNVCSQRICPFEPFTCTMCLDLSDPAGITPGCGSTCNANGTGRLTAHLLTEQGVEFRTIRDQGCCNGCIAPVTKKSNTLLKRTPYITPCGRYTVLCNNYQFQLSEGGSTSTIRPLTCTDNNSTCSALRLINSVVVNTRCGTGAPGTPVIPTQRIDLTLLDNNGVQFRGPTTNVLRNCSIGPTYFNGPTCANIGNSNVVVGIIQSNIQVRLEELRVDTNRAVYPDPTQHPIVTLSVPCATASNLTCTVNQGRFLSYYLIRSDRGLPNSLPGPANAALKYGSVQQNVLRILTPDQLVAAPGLNQWCVLADPFTAYSFNWENFASSGPDLPYTSCRDVDPARVDFCTTNGNALFVIPTDEKK